MNVEDAFELGKDNTSKASEVLRTSVYAGIALVWLFKTPNNMLSGLLILSAIALALALVFDFIQYYLQGLSYRRFAQELRKEALANGENGEEVGKFSQPLPENFTSWPLRLFFAKVLSAGCGYLLLIIEILPRV